jgi:hypothetical protein
MVYHLNQTERSNTSMGFNLNLENGQALYIPGDSNSQDQHSLAGYLSIAPNSGLDDPIPMNESVSQVVCFCYKFCLLLHLLAHFRFSISVLVYDYQVVVYC